MKDSLKFTQNQNIFKIQSLSLLWVNLKARNALIVICIKPDLLHISALYKWLIENSKLVVVVSAPP